MGVAALTPTAARGLATVLALACCGLAAPAAHATSPADVSAIATLVGAPTITAQGEIRYALHIHNDGGDAADGVEIVDPLPATAPLSLVAVYADPSCTSTPLSSGAGVGQYTVAGQTVTIHAGDLADGADGSPYCIELRALGDPSTAGTERVADVAHATFTDDATSDALVGPDSPPAATVTIDPAAALALALSAPTPNPVIAGWPSTATFAYVDAGPSATRAALAITAAGAGVRFATTPAGCTLAGAALTCVPAADVAAGASFSVTVALVGAAAAAGNLSATVIPAADEIDTTSTISASLTILAPPPAPPPPVPPAPPTTGLASMATISPSTGHGTIDATCGASGNDSCRLSATLRVTTTRVVHGRRRKRTASVGTVSGTLGGGRSGRFTVRLTAAERRLLRHRHHLTVIARGTARNREGATVTVSRVVVLELSI